MDHSLPKAISFSVVKDGNYVDLHSRQETGIQGLAYEPLRWCVPPSVIFTPCFLFSLSLSLSLSLFVLCPVGLFGLGLCSIVIVVVEVVVVLSEYIFVNVMDNITCGLQWNFIL